MIKKSKTISQRALFHYTSTVATGVCVKKVLVQERMLTRSLEISLEQAGGSELSL